MKRNFLKIIGGYYKAHDRMIKKGAKVKPEEREAVLKYLSTFK